MKMFNLALFFTLLSINLYGSEYTNKVNELCKNKASVFTSERLYKHEYSVCSKKLLSQNLSIKEINKMISSEDSPEEKRAKIQRRMESSKKLRAHREANRKKYANDVSQPFNKRYKTILIRCRV